MTPTILTPSEALERLGIPRGTGRHQISGRAVWPSRLVAVMELLADHPEGLSAGLIYEQLMTSGYPRISSVDCLTAMVLNQGVKRGYLVRERRRARGNTWAYRLVPPHSLASTTATLGQSTPSGSATTPSA